MEKKEITSSVESDSSEKTEKEQKKEKRPIKKEKGANTKKGVIVKDLWGISNNKDNPNQNNQNNQNILERKIPVKSRDNFSSKYEIDDFDMTSTYEESRNRRSNHLMSETEFENNCNKKPSFNSYVEKDDGFETEEVLPEKIEGIYIYDYNILIVDDILKKKFLQQEKKNIEKLQLKIKIEENKLETRQTLIERHATKKRINTLKEELSEYPNRKKEYIKLTENLIKSYKKIGVLGNIVAFGNEKCQEVTESEEKQHTRHEIIADYLEIARNYIQIDLVRERPSNNSCPGCGANEEVLEDESGASICVSCGLEKIKVVKNPFYSDGCRVNNSTNNYEDEANFEKALMRYQGKQKNKPDPELYSKLDEYFVDIKDLPSSKEICELPYQEDGTKEGTNREMMYEALSKIGCAGYYDDINLICSVYWGWALNDVSHLEEQIMEDYRASQRVFEKLDKEGRKSSLNSQFRLYCLLRKNGVNVKSRDFKIPATPSILEYHKNQWKKICKELNWEYIF